MFISPHDFFIKTNGKIIDVDGMYGGQCWDLFSYFTKICYGKTYGCLYTGTVIDLWEHFEELNLDENFIKVYENYQDGDWLIYKAPASITKSSHIAMLRVDNKDGTNVILTQNPNGNPNYTYQMNLDFKGVVGALRPKMYIKYYSPDPIKKDTNANQIYINTSNTAYCRITPSITDDNKTSDNFLQAGYYNVLEELDIDDNHWYKIEEDRYTLKIDGIVEYIPKEEECDSYILRKILEYIKKIICKFIRKYIKKD